MSRIFDALQEAARLSGSNSLAKEAVWAELGVSPKSIRREGNDSENTGSHDASGSVPPDEVPPTRTLDDPKLPSVARLDTPVKILVDKRVPLLPNTGDPVIVERYRMLRTKLLQEREKNYFRSLVVTSPSPQEGKTVTVLNLALSFAALPSFKVLVIDGDMRRGTLGDWLGMDRSRAGLSNLIEGSASLEEVLTKSEELSMHVIPRGNATVSDLQPLQLRAHFRATTEQFDLVLVDSPPVNPINDVQIIAANCDAVLLVARAFSTTRKGLEEAVEKLQSFRLIGTVLNAGVPAQSRKYAAYY